MEVPFNGKIVGESFRSNPTASVSVARSALAQTAGLRRRLEGLGQVETVVQRPPQQARPAGLGGLRRLQRRRRRRDRLQRPGLARRLVGAGLLVAGGAAPALEDGGEELLAAAGNEILARFGD